MLKKVAASLLAAGLMSSAANAEVVAASVNAVGHTVPTGVSNVKLLSTGETTVSFVAPITGVYAITFSAECAVSGISKALALGFFINGTAVSPALPNRIFCSSNTTTAIDAWASQDLTVPVKLTKGVTYRLQVRAQVSTEATGWLDDFSLIVSY